MLGTLFNHRYRIDAELGRGGVGIVYRGHDTVLERDVAVKVLSTTGIGTQGRARLMREAQAAARLNHPNIIQIFDAGELNEEGRQGQLDQGSNSYIVMELLEGESLFDHKLNGIPEVLAIMQQVCAALEHAHAHGIIHRDLKPENVILSTAGVAKLTDFGLARSVASRMTAEGMIVGTVFYLSPEQALGQVVDARADLYSLGVMLYELTCGRLPFTAENPLAVISQHLHAPVVPPSTYNPEISASLETLILALLSKQPQDRPGSAGEVRRTLEQIASGAVPGDTSRPTRSRLEGLALGRLVGRERELAESKAIWKRAATGSGDEHVLLISGEPGIGKTPFVREIKALAEISGAYILTGESYAEGTAPYAPVTQVIRNALTAIQSRRPEQRLDSSVPDVIMADLLTLAPELSAYYAHVPANPTLEPQAEQQRLFESVFILLSLLSADRPVMLVIEDIQWADCGSLCLVRYLARRMRAENACQMIILSYREAELNETQDLSEVLFDLSREHLSARIKLARYNREQTRQALEVMLRDEVSPDFLDVIYRETEGNIYFIEEMCKALIEEGRLVREGDHWRLTGMDEIQLPQSVRATILSRVSKLPEPTQDVLRLAAVIGREFDFATLRHASDLDEEVLIQALELAVRAQLVEELKDRKSNESFAFTHALIPATLRDSVSSLRRHRLHRRVAAAIENLRSEDDAVLAYHYSRAGDEDKAIHHLTQAGNRAAAVYANEDAVRYYTEALTLMTEDDPGRFDLLVSRARVFNIIARRDDERSDVEALVALAEKVNNDQFRVDALLAQADLYNYADQTRSNEPAERAREIAQRIGDRVREAKALRRLGAVFRQRKDYARSRQDLEQAITLFRQANLINEALVSLHTLSLVLGDIGEMEAARSACQEAISLSRQIGDRRQEAISLRRMAIAYMEELRYQEAIPYAQQALTLHREVGDRGEEAHALNVIGILYAWDGKCDESESALRQSLGLSEVFNSGMSYLLATENLVNLHYRPKGLYEAGLAFIEELLSKPVFPNDEFLSASFKWQKGILLADLGQYRAALDSIQDLIIVSEQLMPETVYPAHILAMIGKLHAELGEFELVHQTMERIKNYTTWSERAADSATLLWYEAYVAWLEGSEDSWQRGIEKAEQAIKILRGTIWTADLPECLYVLAELQLALGRNQEALESTREMIQISKGMPWVFEPFAHTHARALRATGNITEADRYLDEACQRVKLVAELTHNPALRQSWLENVRYNRQVLAECSPG